MKFLPETRYVELLKMLSVFEPYKQELDAYMETPQFDYEKWKLTCERNKVVDEKLAEEIKRQLSEG